MPVSYRGSIARTPSSLARPHAQTADLQVVRRRRHRRGVSLAVALSATRFLARRDLPASRLATHMRATFPRFVRYFRPQPIRRCILPVQVRSRE